MLMVEKKSHFYSLVPIFIAIFIWALKPYVNYIYYSFIEKHLTNRKHCTTKQSKKTEMKSHNVPNKTIENEPKHNYLENVFK